MNWIRTLGWMSVWLSSLGLLGQGQWTRTLRSEEPNESPIPAAARSPLATYLNLGSTVSEKVHAKVLSSARTLQQQAEQEGRSALLVLEIGPGSSRFGSIRDLAKELSSAKFGSLRTIAWIPEPKDKKRIDGNNVILALACNEIVMHPNV